jgi:hypothetical protein
VEEPVAAVPEPEQEEGVAESEVIKLPDEQSISIPGDGSEAGADELLQP